MAGTPLVLDLTERRRAVDADRGRAELARERRLEPEGDIHATAAYRRHLAGVLTAARAAEAAAAAHAERAPLMTERGSCSTSG